MRNLKSRLSAMFLVAAGIVLAMPALTTAQAQTYPDRRITMLVGFSAGSGADIQAPITRPRSRN